MFCREFESFAVEVLNECQQRDPEKASLLVERRHEVWGDQTCLEIAAAAEDKVKVICLELMSNPINRSFYQRFAARTR